MILSSQELGQYFPKDKSPRDMKDHIMKLLEKDFKEKQKNAPAQEKQSKQQPEK